MTDPYVSVYGDIVVQKRKADDRFGPLYEVVPEDLHESVWFWNFSKNSDGQLVISIEGAGDRDEVLDGVDTHVNLIESYGFKTVSKYTITTVNIPADGALLK